MTTMTLPTEQSTADKTDPVASFQPLTITLSPRLAAAIRWLAAFEGKTPQAQAEDMLAEPCSAGLMSGYFAGDGGQDEMRRWLLDAKATEEVAP